MKKIHVNSLEPSKQQLNSLLEYYQAGRYADAEKLSISITQEFPKHPFAWKVLAAVLKQMGRINESLVACQKSLQLDPQDVEAHYNLGNTLNELGRLDKAEVSLRKAIALKPDFAEAHYNLGNTLKKLGRLDESEASYRQAITLKPDLAEAHFNLGNTLKKLGRLKEAEASYSQAIGIKPDFIKAIENRWLLLFQKKNFEAALIDADSYISKGSDQLDLTTLYALGRIDEIYKRIEVRSKTDNENISIAAFAAFVSKVEKKDATYNFCPNPMDYIYYSNISSHLKDSTNYIRDVIKQLDKVTTIWEPDNKTTIKGFQSPTGMNLFESPSGEIAKLKSIIIDELEVYHTKYSGKSCDYIKKWPAQKNLNGWHVILKQQGYQNPHIHRGGWLSGVIYLKVVPSMDKNEGAIEFSLNGENYSDINSSKLTYQPELGDIVFFPSSLHHRTIPFLTDTDRVIVSFDLKPNQLIRQ